MISDGFIRYSKNPVLQPLKLPESPRELKRPCKGMLLAKGWDACKGQSVSLRGQARLMPADGCGFLLC